MFIRLSDAVRMDDVQEECLRDTEALVAEHCYHASQKESGNGICIDCHQAISPKRLQAKPGALRCRPCQEKQEQKQK